MLMRRVKLKLLILMSLKTTTLECLCSNSNYRKDHLHLKIRLIRYNKRNNSSNLWKMYNLIYKSFRHKMTRLMLISQYMYREEVAKFNVPLHRSNVRNNSIPLHPKINHLKEKTILLAQALAVYQKSSFHLKMSKTPTVLISM